MFLVAAPAGLPLSMRSDAEAHLQLHQVSRRFVCGTLVTDELHPPPRASLTNASVKRTEYTRPLDFRNSGLLDFT